MTYDRFTVFLVHSTNHALRAERLLKRAGLPYKLIPVPRHLSSSCGICVRTCHSDRDKVQQLLEQSGVELQGVHDL